MATSQNGYPVLASGSSLLHKWMVPGTGRHFVLRNGSAGFLLVHNALWYHDTIERLDLGTWDEWGWAYRAVRGSTVYSNHASGTATDLNSTRHPLGISIHQTFTNEQIAKIRKRMDFYDDVLRWGGDYQNRPDGMHFELNKPLKDAERVARELIDSTRGKKILAANPGQRAVILS